MPGRHSDAEMLSSLIHRLSPGRPARCEESWSELIRAVTGGRSLGALGLGEGHRDLLSASQCSGRKEEGRPFPGLSFAPTVCLSQPNLRGGDQRRLVRKFPPWAM